jgi:hypothetical protein
MNIISRHFASVSLAVIISSFSLFAQAKMSYIDLKNNSGSNLTLNDFSVAQNYMNFQGNGKFYELNSSSREVIRPRDSARIGVDTTSKKNSASFSVTAYTDRGDGCLFTLQTVIAGASGPWSVGASGTDSEGCKGNFIVETAGSRYKHIRHVIVTDSYASVSKPKKKVVEAKPQ